MENKQNTALTIQERNISEGVLTRVKELEKEGNLQLPANYSCSNALKSAWLILQETVDRNQKPVLQNCSKESIANSLLDMVIQGLSPSKKQCYFIPYGGKLQLSRSYMGTVAVTKRLKGITDVKAYCIYEGDEFETLYNVDTATLNITKFNPKFENIDITKIKGAFAVVLGENGPVYTEIMNINQIRKAWGQGAAKGNSGAHTNFTDEMAKKTVINRACKMFANTSDDSDLLIQAFNNSDEKPVEDTDNQISEEIKEKANSKPIDIKQDNVVETEYKEVKDNSKAESNAEQQNNQEGPEF